MSEYTNMKTKITLASKSALSLLASTAILMVAWVATATPPAYVVTNLISDLSGVAANMDTNLVNPWGLYIDPFSNLYVADNGSDQVTFYLSDGTPTGFNINAASAPSGIEYNPSTNDFIIGTGSNATPAKLLISTESGTILGFNLVVSFNTSLVAVDRSAEGSVYKGLAIARVWGRDYLYATDFHNGKI